MQFMVLYTRLRVARLHRWAMLWLTWFVGFLEVAANFAPLSKSAQAIGHRWLDAIEQRIFTIVLARSAPWLTPIRAGRAGPRSPRGALRRALMGSRLRRKLRDKDIYARVEKLASDIDTLIGLHCRRIARGLTRLLPIVTRPERRRAQTALAPRAVVSVADTS